MTVLELLIVLVIGAMIATLVAISVPQSAPTPSDNPASFLAYARVEAAATGRPIRVAISAGAMTDGRRHASWGNGVTISLGGKSTEGYVVFHGDGTMVGPEVRIVIDGSQIALAPDRIPSLSPP